MKKLGIVAAVTLFGASLAQAPAEAAASMAARMFDPNTKTWIELGPARGGVGKRSASPIRREVVAYAGPHGPNTIVVDTSERRLYYTQADGTALKYGVGVGREGFEWTGTNRVTRKAEWPGWTPPPAMRKRRPDLPAYMEGGPNNPLGARAMYLGSSYYRIHGSNEPWTIGQAVSSGCIRMANEDVIDLYGRVKIGTRVVVQN